MMAGEPARLPRELGRAQGLLAFLPRIALRGVESGERLGRHRWWWNARRRGSRFRRLAVRYERRADIIEVFHRLAAGLICLGFVRRWFC
jgi:hypothetical protein